MPNLRKWKSLPSQKETRKQNLPVHQGGKQLQLPLQSALSPDIQEETTHWRAKNDNNAILVFD